MTQADSEPGAVDSGADRGTGSPAVEGSESPEPEAAIGAVEARKPGTFTPENAAMMAARALEARAGKRLLPSDVLAVLGELQTPGDARRWLEATARWVALGSLDKGQGAVVSRCLAEWIKAYTAGETDGRLTEAREALAALRAQLKAQGSPVRRVS